MSALDDLILDADDAVRRAPSTRVSRSDLPLAVARLNALCDAWRAVHDETLPNWILVQRLRRR